MNWRLCLLILVLLPLLVLAAKFFGRRLKFLSTSIQDQTAALSTLIEEVISGIRIVKSFVQTQREETRFAAQVEQTLTLTMRRASIMAVFIPVISLLTFSSAAAVLWYGGRQVIDGAVSPGDLFAFVLFAGILIGPFSSMLDVPWTRVITRPCILALFVAHFANGWGFYTLLTWLPKYLQDVKHVESSMGGLMSTLVLFAGIIGMLSGGPLADFCGRTMGRRWGRSLPLAGCYAVAVAAYLSCLFMESAWGFIAAAAVVAFATDLSGPTIWAYMQDIGGKNSAAVFGGGNMWGNLGAATTPLLVPIVLEYWDTNGDWHEAFIMFSIGYVVAVVAALLSNSERVVE